MVITVDLRCEPAAVGLADPDDCKRFHVEVAGASGRTDDDTGRVAHALVDRGIGRVIDGHAFVDVGALRQLASGRVPEGWDAEFEAMLDYARSKGWFDETGNAIQGHIEWQG